MHASGQATSGEYTVWVNGVTPTVVYCDMVTDGGGWTVFQRRQDAATNFDRLWAEYKQGFGNKGSSFWLGLDTIHEMTKHTMTMRFDLTLASGSKYHATYNKFKVGSEATNYRLEVSGYSGNSGDAFTHHNTRQFTTRDRDNDNYAGYNCAYLVPGGWWYSYCYRVCLNSLYSSTDASVQYIQWVDNLGGHPIIFAEMKFRGKAPF